MDAEHWLTEERRLIERDEWTPPKLRAAVKHQRGKTFHEYGTGWLETCRRGADSENTGPPIEYMGGPDKDFRFANDGHRSPATKTGLPAEFVAALSEKDGGYGLCALFRDGKPFRFTPEEARALAERYGISGLRTEEQRANPPTEHRMNPRAALRELERLKYGPARPMSTVERANWLSDNKFSARHGPDVRSHSARAPGSLVAHEVSENRVSAAQWPSGSRGGPGTASAGVQVVKTLEAAVSWLAEVYNVGPRW